MCGKKDFQITRKFIYKCMHTLKVHANLKGKNKYLFALQFRFISCLIVSSFLMIPKFPHQIVKFSMG